MPHEASSCHDLEQSRQKSKVHLVHSARRLFKTLAGEQQFGHGLIFTGPSINGGLQLSGRHILFLFPLMILRGCRGVGNSLGSNCSPDRFGSMPVVRVGLLGMYGEINSFHDRETRRHLQG